MILAGMFARQRAAAPGGGGGSDPDWASVVSLLHFEGANNSTTFTDSKDSTSWTVGGGAKISTTSPIVGTSSGVFDGNGDFISRSFPGIADSQPFTWEMRVRLSSLSGWQILAGLPSADLLMNFNHSGNPNKFQAAVAGTQINGSMTPAVDTDYVICVERVAGGTVRLYVDGAVDGTTTRLNAIGSGTMYIGCIPPYGGDTLALNGRMDEYRMTVGVGRYNGAYTPSAPFPDS